MGLMEHLELEDSSSNHSNLLTEKNITDANKDTFINRTAISQSRYSGIHDSLLKFVEGIPIVVDYFKRNISYLEKHSGEVTFSLERSDVEYSFTHIHTMEMKLKDQLTIEYDSETTETTIEGSALIYPGVDPNIGDLFLYELPDNLTGVFIINGVKRLSIQQGSHYEVDFNLWNFLDTDIQDKIQANVVESLYFSKQKYLSNDVTLLKDDSYNQLKTLINYKSKLINLFTSQVYNDDLMTVVYEEDEFEIFDPFVIEFLNYSISLKDKKRNIDQLCGNVLDVFYPYSLWKSIVEKDRFIIRYKNSILTKSDFEIWDSSITSVLNTAIVTITDKISLDDLDPYVLIEDAVLTPYVFSENFYSLIPLTDDEINDDTYISNTITDMDEFELFLMRFIVNKTLDATKLIDDFLCKYPYSDFTSKEIFYKLPIYIFLINFAIYDLS